MYDIVQFNFMAKNHTVTQSTFPKPCNKMMGGIDSGFMANNGTGTPPMLMVQVNSTKPIWFYCRQKKPMPHCGAGMTFSINPTADKSQAAFKAQAIVINGTGAAAGMMAAGASMPAGVSMPAAAASVAPAMTMATQAAVAATTMAMAAQAAAVAATQAAAVAQPNSAAMDAGSMIPAANPTMASGSGQANVGGSCTCSCMCGTQAFAAGSGLGLGMFGGLPGKLEILSAACSKHG